MDLPFLKTTFRHLQRHTTYTVLSLSGLVIGLVTSLLIFMWIVDEWSYDKQHPENDRVFRVMYHERQANGEVLTLEETPSLLADYLKQEIPEVEKVCRAGFWERKLLSLGNTAAYFDGRFADAEFVSVFNLTLLAGDPKNLIPDSRSIIVSRRIAETFFPNGDALGKFIQVDRKDEMKITGIYENHSRLSSLGEEFLLPISVYLGTPAWDNLDVGTYVKLKRADADATVNEKIHDKINRERNISQTSLSMFRLTDWRLHWRFLDGKVNGGRIDIVIAFGIIAAFILVMACINYMNLATARAAMRAKEIGVRKMSGATRRILVRQFLGESLVISFSAGLLSLLGIYLTLPLFCALTGKELTFALFDSVLLPAVFTFSLISGLLAGSYPAFVLASLKPSTVLKGNLLEGLTGAVLRKYLVIFQFSLSLILIVAAVVIQQQVDFLRSRDLGFDQKNVLYIEPGQDSNLSVDVFRTEALRHPGVKYVVEGAASPMEINGVGTAEVPAREGNQQVVVNGATCDYDYLPALGFTFVTGRNFSRGHASDSNAFVITEKAADMIGFENPIGQRITYGKTGTIIGVIRDFHNAEIHETAAPVIFFLGDKESFGYWRRLFIGYQPGQLNEVRNYLKAVYEKLEPGLPLEFGFLDRDFDSQFRSDNLLGSLAIWFTVIAVAIACLGLFGLTLFNTQRRTKEIGVRKVLGASVVNLVFMFCLDFSRPVIISITIAVPVAYLLVEQFLQRYPLRMDLPWMSVAVTSVALLAIALLTVSYQSLRAARQNPVEALKTE